MIFEVEGPDGTVYEVDAPSAEKAAAAIRSMSAPEKGFGQRLKENILGDDDPTTLNAGEAIGAFLNKAGESLTFGLVGDEAAAAADAAIGRGSYDDRLQMYRQDEEVLERDHPGAALTADIGGAVAGAAVPIGAAVRAGGIGQRVLQSGLTGAAMGGTYGFMEGEGADDRVDEMWSGAQLGGAVGGLAPVGGAAVQKIADSIVAKRAMNRLARGAEDAASQRAASGAQYDAFEQAGAELSPEAMTRLRQAVEARLQRSGMSNLPGGANRTPGAQQIMNTVGQMDDQVRAAAQAGQNPAVPLKSVEELRRLAGDVAQDVNPVGRATADARLGSIAVDEIDTFVDGLQAADVPIGDPKVAVEALTKARALWKQASKSQIMENVLEQQDNYLGGSASAIRNRVGSILRNPKMSRQFSEAEKKVLRKIIGGNTLTRTIRLLGNGLGRQAQMLGGAGVGGIPGAIAGAATGELTGAVADRNAVRAAELARDIMANGGIESLPVASEQIRRFTEALARRSGASVPQ